MNLSAAPFDDVAYSSAARLVSPRPSLPQIMIHGSSLVAHSAMDQAERRSSDTISLSSKLSSRTSPHPKAVANSTKFLPTDQMTGSPLPDATSDQEIWQEPTQLAKSMGDKGRRERERKRSGILRKPMVYLRSYSTPNAYDLVQEGSENEV